MNGECADKHQGKKIACLAVNDAIKLIVSAFSLELKTITFITISIQSMLWFTKPAVMTADADLGEAQHCQLRVAMGFIPSSFRYLKKQKQTQSQLRLSCMADRSN